MRKTWLKEGFSLVEVLIAMGLTGIVALIFSSMISQQNAQVKLVTEKLASVDLTNLMMTVWSDPTICTQQLSAAGTTFDSTRVGTSSPPVIPLTEVKGPGNLVLASVGTQVSPIAPGFRVESILINNINGSGNDFIGNLSVRFAVTPGSRRIKPALIGVKLQTDPASPAAAKQIVGCGGSAAQIFTLNTLSYSCTARRNSSCTINSDPGMKFCALSNVDNAGCTKCANFKCEVVGPDANGVFTLRGRRGGDPDSFCRMSCF